ncbi:MAG TPA: hypothetical protein PK109_00710 [Candidatus Paceibacterota bacterium]|nr:hypothetical protein [Candidatus Paceibacterota bacterium]
MRKDTKTFLTTVLGIPLVLSGAWGVNTANQAGVVVYEREAVAEDVPEVVVVPEVKEETPPPVTVPAPKPVPVAVTPPPVVPAPPPPAPVVVATVTPPVAPAPKPVVKKSRRTRAS